MAHGQRVETAARELEAGRFALLHAPRKDPWGQTVARLLSSKVRIAGISFAPWLQDDGARE